MLLEFQRLMSAQAVRDRCYAIAERSLAGETRWFRINQSNLSQCVEYVARECLQNYPDLQIPYHSRWRHFQVGQSDLWQYYRDQRLGVLNEAEQTRVAIDLVFLSVLLDAGAGSQWTYREPVTGIVLNRSEGLAAASVDLFFNVLFNTKDNYRLDSNAIKKLTPKLLANALQHRPDNPLVGVDGRLELLQGLGKVLDNSTRLDRPGDLYDVLMAENSDGNLEAGHILKHILIEFGSMWPGGLIQAGENLGDAGFHELIEEPDTTKTIVPFHKLSQWLSYSLIEPLQWVGMQVTGLDQLTGLPEYRNGGLFLDIQLIEAIDPGLLQQTLKVQSEPVVEWRALTVYLLDQVARGVREKLSRTAAELPLASVLQGGTWSAGRKIAAEKRPGGTPPLNLAIDGTIF